MDARDRWGRGQRLANRLGTLLLAVALTFTVGVPWQWAGSPRADMDLGVNFSCRRAQQLVPGTDCDVLFALLLDDLGVRRVRLALYWDELEPEEGRFDFEAVDRLVAAAAARDAKLLPIIGMRSAHRPEFYIPHWLQTGAIPFGRSPADDPAIAERTLRMVSAAISHLAASTAIEGWQIENEPGVRPDGDGREWALPNDFLAREIVAAREADPLLRPVLVSDATSQFWQRGWMELLAMADGIGLSFYSHRPDSLFAGGGEVRPYEIGALGPDIWHQVTRAAFAGKRAWLVELQAEPWEGTPIAALGPGEESSISPELMRANVALARRTGATRAYLWGSEWWWYMRTRWGDGRYWDTARDLLRGGAGR